MEWSLFGFLSIFFIGLSLNLTPCVYPMLSVTVALFSGSEEKNLLSSFLRACVYVLGISVIYSTLGVAAAFTGQFFGAALQNPILLIAFAILMFALALSMFGIYEFQVPSVILNRVGGKRRAGLIGIFFSGLLVGVFAAPCIGPPIVALLLFVGQTANPVSGFFVFLVLSLGLGAPYLLLGTFSNFLKKLPRSGEWLLWVKKIFGVLLLSLALYYLSLAIFPPIFKFLLPFLIVTAAVYLGFVDKTGNKLAWFVAIKRILSVAVLIGALVSFFFFSRPGVVWESFSESKLTEARKAAQPVVIDFYADWCIPCHELEQFTYSDKRVIEALGSARRFKVDLTNPNSSEMQKIIEDYEVIGVPTVVFLDSNGNEVVDSRVTGFVPPEMFLELVGPILKHNPEEKTK